VETLHKIPWKPLIIVLIVAALLGGGGYGYYLTYVKVEPEVLLPESLGKTMAVSDYRYWIEVLLVKGDQEQILSSLSGEKAGDNFHLQGEMAGEPIEIYHVNQTTYTRTQGSDRWMKYPLNDLRQANLLFGELNPLQNLEFAAYSALVYEGRAEAIGAGRVHVLRLKPELEDNLISRYFENFEYTLNIGTRDHLIKTFEIKAANKMSPDNNLKISVRLFDFNQVSELVLPEGID